MPKPKSYSLNTKITLSFTILGFLLIAILFIQIIPNMQSEQKEYKRNQIERMVTLTTGQIKLGVQLLVHERERRLHEIELFFKNKIEYLIKNKNIKSTKKKEFELKNLAKEINCNIYTVDNQKNTLFSTNNLLLNEEKNALISNENLSFFRKKQEHMCPKKTEDILYSKYLKSIDETLVFECKPRIFKTQHKDLEDNIKDDLQKSFNLSYKDHQGKLNLIWINSNYKQFDNKPLYDVSDNLYNNKYCLSRMSSSSYPQTGLLTSKQIILAANKEPIYHLLNSNENPNAFVYPALTWVKTIKNMEDSKLLFLTTIYLKDFNRDFYSPLFKILPAAVLSILVAVLLGFFLFKKLFKSINILTNTAKQINKGNLNFRSKIKGEDDISILAKTFDDMLDSIEKNINELDEKVELKTKELRNSLEEKEILLQEIHHRVKNNLTMTINLIKLQKSKISDLNTKNTLTDIQERIFTMELLHRKLYESKDLNSISFEKYVLELIEDLDNTYGKDKDIKINTSISDISMNIEYALPCGLIITECITNAYKYAFKNNGGELNISFKRCSSNCTLVISDNGVGLAKDIDINKTKTLGLKLVSTIVKGQLFGSFTYKYEEGAKFTIIFEYHQEELKNQN